MSSLAHRYDYGRTPSDKALEKMNAFYYMTGGAFMAAAFVPAVGWPVIVFLVGLAFFTAVPVGNLLETKLTWSGYFFTLNCLYAAMLAYPREPALMVASVAFLAGALLTALNYFEVSAPFRLYAWFGMAINLTTVSAMLWHVVKP